MVYKRALGTGLAMATLIAALVAGCGKAKAPDIDTTPFRDAVQVYLASKSMDLKVFEFKTLAVEDNNAEAEISLEHAGGMVGPKVRWRFWFERKAGKWQVSRHES